MLAILALSLAGAACATSGRSPTASSATVPLAVNSVGSSYGIQLRLDGTAAVRDGWVHVTVPSGLARTYQGETSIWDLLLRARLATCTGGEWEVAADSRALRVAPAVGLERDAAILDTAGRAFGDTLRFELAVPPGTTLQRSWVAFELAWPIENTLAAYTLHTRAALTPSEPRWNVERSAEVRCRD